MPIVHKKWEDFDEHDRGWSMMDKESYERACRELDDMTAKMQAEMPRENFLVLIKDMGHDWVD
jgi:hypothetical protein